MPDNRRKTFEGATAKTKMLMLYDDIQELKGKYRERKKIDIGMIVAVILLAIKSVLFGK